MEETKEIPHSGDFVIDMDSDEHDFDRSGSNRGFPEELQNAQVHYFTQPLNDNNIELNEILPIEEGMRRLGQLGQAAANDNYPDDYADIDYTLVGKALKVRIIQNPRSASGGGVARYAGGVLISAMSVILYIDPTIKYAAGRPMMQAVLVTGATGANFSVTFFFVDEIFSKDKLPEDIIEEIVKNQETRDKLVTKLVNGIGGYVVGLVASVPFIAVAQWPGHCATECGQLTGNLFAVGSTAISMTLLNRFAVCNRIGNDVAWLGGKCSKDDSLKAYKQLVASYSKSMHYYAKQIAMRQELLEGLEFDSELSPGRMIARIIEYAEENQLVLPSRTLGERVALWGCGTLSFAATDIGIAGYGLATYYSIQKYVPVVGVSHVLAFICGFPYGYLAGMGGAATGMMLLKVTIDLVKKCRGKGDFSLPLAFQVAPGWSVGGSLLMLGFSATSYATTAGLAVKYGLPPWVVFMAKGATIVINNYFASQVALEFAERIAANKYYVDGFSCCGAMIKCGSCSCCGKEVNCGGTKKGQKRTMFFRAVRSHLSDIKGFPIKHNLDYFQAIPENKRHWLFATLERDKISTLISQARESEGLLSRQQNDDEAPQVVRMHPEGRAFRPGEEGYQGTELSAAVYEELENRGRFTRHVPFSNTDEIV